MKRRLVIVDDDDSQGDAGEARGDRGDGGDRPRPAMDTDRDPHQHQTQQHHDQLQEYSTRAAILNWIKTGNPPASYACDELNRYKNRHKKPLSPTATSDELFLPVTYGHGLGHHPIVRPQEAGPSRLPFDGPAPMPTIDITEKESSDSDSSVLTAKYIRSVRDEMPAKGISSKRRRKSKPPEDGPSFFAKGPAGLDPDGRLASARRSLIAVGPVDLSGRAAKVAEDRSNSSSEENRDPRGHRSGFRSASADSGIHLVESRGSARNARVAEFREVFCRIERRFVSFAGRDFPH